LEKRDDGVRVSERGITFLSDRKRNVKEKTVFSDLNDALGRGKMCTVVREKRFVQGGTAPRFLLEISVHV
jgi:hypothetical protein